MNYPKSNTLTSELYRYIKEYQLENHGRSPTLRDCIADGVGGKSRKKAVTSTSVIDYHLQKLISSGLVKGPDFAYATRQNTIAGGIFAIPRNILYELTLDEYRLCILDSNGLEESAKIKLVWHLFKLVKYVCTFEFTDLEQKGTVWELDRNRIPHVRNQLANVFKYQNGDAVYQNLEDMRLMFDVHQSETAVITDSHDIKLAALGMDYGIFSIDDIQTDMKYKENGQDG